MEDKAPAASQPVFTSGPGAVYRAVHMVRDVKIYPIEENELKTLSMFSAIVTVVTSVGSIVVGFLMSIWWDMFTSNNAAKATVGTGITVAGGGVILVCIGIAVWAQRSRQSELRKILGESRLIGVSDSAPR